MIIVGVGSGKTTVQLNLITLFLRRRSIRIKLPITYQWKRKSRDYKQKNQKTLIDASQTIYDVYENLEKYNSRRKRKLSIVFDDMAANMEADKKSKPTVSELFMRGRKLNI